VFWVEDPELGHYGSGFRVQGSGMEVEDFGVGVQDTVLGTTALHKFEAVPIRAGI
jgi:hypothetical protein